MNTGLQGHNISCDNFFTSYDLGQEVLRRKLTIVGMVKKNKPKLPAEISQVKGRASLSSRFTFTDTTTVVFCCPKKILSVVLLSSLQKDAAVSSGKPTIILDYNKNKGRLDNLDKLTVTYTCQRMTRRWPWLCSTTWLMRLHIMHLCCGPTSTKGGTQTKNTSREFFLRTWEIQGAC
ncbi:hypothetical protein NL108_013386 [Boleophthalmus pectinirostris]|nr:hypothetical protein NL108_013386 [Boleophthalmus pectinirostris]